MVVETQMARLKCRELAGRVVDGICEGTGRRVKQHREDGKTLCYGRCIIALSERHEPPWYGTVCPVVWGEEGATSPPTRFPGRGPAPSG